MATKTVSGMKNQKAAAGMRSRPGAKAPAAATSTDDPLKKARDEFSAIRQHLKTLQGNNADGKNDKQIAEAKKQLSEKAREISKIYDQQNPTTGHTPYEPPKPNQELEAKWNSMRNKPMPADLRTVKTISGYAKGENDGKIHFYELTRVPGVNFFSGHNEEGAFHSFQFTDLKNRKRFKATGYTQ